MINKSVWQKNFENYPQLINDIERETVIIGGGIAGFLTAFRLSEEGAKVTLIEADKIFPERQARRRAKFPVIRKPSILNSIKNTEKRLQKILPFSKKCPARLFGTNRKV